MPSRKHIRETLEKVAALQLKEAEADLKRAQLRLQAERLDLEKLRFHRVIDRTAMKLAEKRPIDYIS